MQAERKRIYQLSYEELRNLLIVNYIKVGIQMTLDDSRLRIAIPDVYRYFGKLWTDTLDNIFSEFAGGPSIRHEKIAVTVSSIFIKKIKEFYFLNLEHAKDEQKPKREKLTDKQYAYYNLIEYCLLYNKFPVNIDWQLILSYLVDNGHFKPNEGLEGEHFALKEKTARVHVKSWVKENMPKIKINMNKMQMAA